MVVRFLCLERPSVKGAKHSSAPNAGGDQDAIAPGDGGAPPLFLALAHPGLAAL